MDVLGRLQTQDQPIIAGYAVVARDPINFRNFSSGLKNYDALELEQMAEREIEKPESTPIDTFDAQLIISGFQRIKALRDLLR